MAKSQRSQPASARDWMLTLRKQDCPDASTLQTHFAAMGVSAAVFQLERGEKTGYEHWQALVRFKSQKRFTTFKRQLSVAGLATAHIEPRHGSVAQAVAYCSKEETRLDGPYFYGDSIDVESHQGHRSDLDALRSMVLDDGMSVDEILLSDASSTAARYTQYLRDLVQARDRKASKDFRHLEVVYLYGRPGVGKTRWAMQQYSDDVYRVSDYGHPFDSYAGQKTLVLDEFDGSLPMGLLLNLLDGYALELPARYSNRIARYERVIIISNSPLSSFYTTTVDPSSTPDRLRALYRRISKYCFMDSDGALLEKPLPTIGRTHDNAVWRNDVHEDLLPEEIF